MPDGAAAEQQDDEPCVHHHHLPADGWAAYTPARPLLAAMLHGGSSSSRPAAVFGLLSSGVSVPTRSR